MKYFSQALKDASRHKFIIAAAMACSLAVAALWTLNIGALFPIIQTTLNGQSLQSWNQQRIDSAEKDAVGYQAQVIDLDRQLAAANVENRQAIEIARAKAEGQVTKAKLTAEWAGKIQPLFERWMPSTPFSTVVLVVCLVVGATALKQLLAVTNQLLVSYVSQSIARDVRSRIFNKALALDRPKFNTQGISGFTAHITHTTDMLAQGITAFYGGAITEPLRIVFCLILAAFISWRLTVASLIFAPLAAFLMLHLNRRIRALSFRVLDRSLGFHHIMLEVFNSLHTVQAYSMEEFERKRFREATGQIKRTAMWAAFYNALSSPITEFLGMGMLCTGLCVSSYLVIFRATSIFGIPMTNTPFEPAIITVFFAALIAAADPLRKLSGVITGLNTGMAAANLLYPMLDLESGLVEPTTPKALPSDHKQVEFRNVTFSYDGSHQALSGVNLTVKRGEHLAIVGPNGGGKSTLLQLLLGRLSPTAGTASLGAGVVVGEIEQARTTFVAQAPVLEVFGRCLPNWATADVRTLLAKFGLGTALLERSAASLSPGERTRVAMALLQARGTNLLVLDEPTNHLDLEAIEQLEQALDAFDGTILLVTHDRRMLDTVRLTRRWHVDGGMVAEIAAD